jgi:hypothetical protein
MISPGLKKIIKNILSKKFNDVTKDYHKLMLPEQNLLNVISKYLGFNNNTLDNDEAFHDRFSVIHAQIMSGNDNVALKMEAKKISFGCRKHE